MREGRDRGSLPCLTWIRSPFPLKRPNLGGRIGRGQKGDKATSIRAAAGLCPMVQRHDHGSRAYDIVVQQHDAIIFDAVPPTLSMSYVLWKMTASKVTASRLARDEHLNFLSGVQRIFFKRLRPRLIFLSCYHIEYSDVN